jgi:3D (Asp-Asp-Asp) domain-containing protein
MLFVICATNISSTSSKVYLATAYCLRGRTASGIMVRRGIVAADTKLHKLGSKLSIQAGSYSGQYLVADRGKKIRGRRLDLWMPNCKECRKFGKRKVIVN